MAKKQKKDTKVKMKKKVWYNVVAPASFNSKEIGETYLENPQQGLGRKMTVSLKDLTGSMRDQNVQIKLQLSDVKGTSLHTTPIGYSVVPTFVKRLVRKRTSRLDDVFTLKAGNDKPVVLKMLIVTYGRVNKSMATILRMKVRALMKEELSKSDFESFVPKLVTLKVQGPIKRALGKFFPIKEVLVRSAELVDEAKAKRMKESEVKDIQDTRVKVQKFDDATEDFKAAANDEDEEDSVGEKLENEAEESQEE